MLPFDKSENESRLFKLWRKQMPLWILALAGGLSWPNLALRYCSLWGCGVERSRLSRRTLQSWRLKWSSYQCEDFFIWENTTYYRNAKFGHGDIRSRSIYFTWGHNVLLWRGRCSPPLEQQAVSPDWLLDDKTIRVNVWQLSLEKKEVKTRRSMGVNVTCVKDTHRRICA